MFTSDFVARYGYPKRTPFAGPVAGTLLVPRNPYRYSLWITVSGGSVVVGLGSSSDLAIASVELSPISPLKIRFANDGTLCCEEWFLVSNAGAANISVYEMIANPGVKREELPHVGVEAIAAQEPNLASHGGFGPGITTQSRPQGSLTDEHLRRRGLVVTRRNSRR